jgi:hypothetical protein
MYAVGLQRQVLCRSGFKFNIMKSLFNKVVRVFERLASPKPAREIGKHLHLFVTITDSMQSWSDEPDHSDEHLCCTSQPLSR